MKTALQRQVLANAPVWLVVVAALTAASLITLGVARPADPGVLARGWVLGAALSRVALFGATTFVLAWRSRVDVAEQAVWRWLARAAGLATAASVVAGGLDVARACAVPVPGGLGAGVLGLGVLGACPLLYQGLIHWNRYGTLTSQPGDWLNGVGAVFALTALGGLLLPWLQSPLMQWPSWQTQLWLLRVAAEIMLLGTAVTVLVIGALHSDIRAWALTATIALVVALDVTSAADAVAAAGAGPLADVGWSAVALALAASAVLRPPPPLPRPVTTTAPTAGSFVVLLASISVLVATGMLHTTAPGTARMVRYAAAWAGLGALGVTVRGLQLIRLLAHLVITRHEALTDDLTGLANRRALDRALTEALDQSRDKTPDKGLENGLEKGPAQFPGKAREQGFGELPADQRADRFGDERTTTLMLIDLDGFKEVNDRFGHAVGDELLRRAGALLRRVSPPHALPARLGGDEFAILLPGTSLQTAVALFTTLAEASSAPVLVEGRRLLARASVGIATATAGESAEQLLRHADAAMYRAKTAGGAQVAVHDAAAALATEQRAQLVEELKVLLGSADAVDDLNPGHLVVYYQPQVDAAGEVAGAEALVRWNNPRLGLLTPDRFLNLVEEYALMPDLTATVIWQAARQAVRWQQAGYRLRMSVNLSASCLTHPALLPLVDEVLAQTGLQPADLVLEVTETSLMADPGESIARLHDLAARGIDISIDDYGSGYSSLAYLHDLPATELKLDRSLTAQVTSNPRTAEIVAGTVALAHRLGLRVIAEGVEDTTMLQALHALGCDETQGYLHARPMPADALHGWLTVPDATTATPQTATTGAPTIRTGSTRTADAALLRPGVVGPKISPAGAVPTV